MSCILNIETSTEVCSVAVSQNGLAVFSKEDMKGPSHAVQLGSFVDEALSFVDSQAIPLDAVAISCGPGSYTGLRIGTSMAKGVCFGRDLPLIAVSSLEILCVPVLLQHDLPEDALLCPMIDARRMEVYAAIYDRSLKMCREVSADVIDENSYHEFLDHQPVYFFGNGDRVSFAVRAGERWGIAGESGAGKSMTMNAITALLPGKSARISGKILYRLEDGTWQDLLQIPYRNRHEFVSRHVAVIFQDSINALNPNERVERQWAETVFLHKGRLAAGECRAHLLRQMDVFSIRGGDETLRKFPHQLSGGMRQRIAIAMALESDAHIIIADEPTTSLDTITQRATVNYLDDICRRSGGTLLYISHNLGILQAICDHIMVMKDGRVVEQGLADDVFFRGQDPYTRTIVGETLKIMGRGQA